MTTTFEIWLREKLTAELEIASDDDVYVPYILGMLEDEEDLEEIAEGIQSILAGISDNVDQIQAMSRDIQAHWRQTQNAAPPPTSSSEITDKKMRDLSAQLASIAASKTAAYTAARNTGSGHLDVDQSVKAAILAQYAGRVEDSSGEEDEDDDGDAADDHVMRNTNAEVVARAEAEKREKCRAAAMAKKEKDAEDRERQKTMAEDRKKKAQDKAAKGERRK
ncbi:hypothetical protein TCAL_10888 [Tigriopus californicus]|uniref:Coiled-coil domain-containing protein 43 n=1 Tax=Tigriopus californicus TaxID=6832 RepID=A0A553NF14_TIGCA|nr:coiled-coil domain-containing protein 43-like [Tigriopus californicus]TRY64043.1 hypothetical protein TCAL_10888 [Tigriopus californicus]|eukprot:TCALIF_10888-PA protein Name:"Similar to ccdc43 Coiled-coil domain-containing protein 43 (Danio rerio)" AED:0.26 eAED:0.26 QI:0/-1/0/1/-1/1/1/0/220